MTDASAGSARFGDAFAASDDLLSATRQAVSDALAPLDQSPDLLVIFASGPSGPDLDGVGALAQELSGAAHVIGCSAAGVCGAGGAVLGSSGVSVFAAVLPGVRARVFHLEVIRSDDGLAVVGLPELRSDETTAVIFVDPYSFPVVSFVDRSGDVLPEVSLVGGVAGGPNGAGSTRLYLDGRTTDRGAVGLLIAGVPTQVVVSQGCRPVGPEMVITKADGNLLLELAGVPALTQLYRVLEELTPAERITFGSGPQLGVAMNEYKLDQELGDYLIRGVIGIDETREAVAVADVVEVGRTVRFQLRDAAAARADLRARLAPAAAAKGALLISCNGRGPAMFGRAESDVELVSECLGGSPVGGLFAGGEVGPVGGRNWLHSFTASVLAFM
ncbi:MAG: histidine kinase [Mycobacterium sp.]|nr:histidine kinase [Mycobacterium sp.]